MSPATWGQESSKCNILYFFSPLHTDIEPRVQLLVQILFLLRHLSFYFSSGVLLSSPKLDVNSQPSHGRPWTWDLPALESGWVGLQVCATRACTVLFKCYPKVYHEAKSFEWPHKLSLNPTGRTFSDYAKRQAPKMTAVSNCSFHKTSSLLVRSPLAASPSCDAVIGATWLVFKKPLMRNRTDSVQKAADGGSKRTS